MSIVYVVYKCGTLAIKAYFPFEHAVFVWKPNFRFRLYQPK